MLPEPSTWLIAAVELSATACPKARVGMSKAAADPDHRILGPLLPQLLKAVDVCQALINLNNTVPRSFFKISTKLKSKTSAREIVLVLLSQIKNS